MRSLILRTWLLAIFVAQLVNLQAASLRSDENVIFFPGLGWKTGDGLWNLEVRGWIFEKERRPGASRLLMQYLAIDPDLLTASEKEIFTYRSRLFLIDTEHGKKVSVSVAGKAHLLSTSRRDGFFSGTIRIPETALETIRISAAGRHVPIVLDSRHTPAAAGSVELVPEEGLSVVSDIDDTIKISDVRNREKLLRNTFLENFKAVPGMAAVYRYWQTNEAAAFHYVSGSPYQLYVPLAQFLSDNEFPKGSFHLRAFNLENGWAQLSHGPHSYKLSTIEPLFLRFPKREFVLVGDSGEHDPEIYAELGRKFGKQIRHIYIRDVTGENADSERYVKAFAKVPASRWSIFTGAQQLR